MTTTRRLFAALLIAGSLVLPAGAASAAPDPGDGVRVSVEITEREVPAGPRVVVGDGPYVVGGELVVRGSGLTPHGAYEVWLESDPVLLATVTADEHGAFELVVRIPDGTAPGEHHLRLVAQDSGPEVRSEDFVVRAAPGRVPRARCHAVDRHDRHDDRRNLGVPPPDRPGDHGRGPERHRRPSGPGDRRRRRTPSPPPRREVTFRPVVGRFGGGRPLLGPAVP